ncbi:GcvT family protein [Oceanibium sediminis]|uniref:GcvT family protein n=1 Tax=Oceanibium sediminis TaxID=2026339 RepID=UPI000DD3E111|nr:FAD-dependent oxidoreductase [Oceanibium sediminis]
MRNTARVVVIGGGVVGASVLYHLARAGWSDCLLIERSELTSGSSWHAAGGFHTLNGDPNVAKLQAYTIGLYRELEEISGLSCGLHLTGGFQMADTPERMDFLRAAHAKGRALGMEMELVTPDDAKAMFPLLDTKHFVGGLWDPVEGNLDPSGTTHAYAKAAQMLGAEIALRTPVKELTQDPDGTWNVVTEAGTVRAEHVVNAAGLWAREVGRMVGLELPLLAMEHMYLLTDDIPEVIAFNEATGREVCHIIDFKGEIYTRQERNGLLVGTYERACKPWSPRSTPWDFGHELLPPDLDRIAPNLEIGFRHFPALERTGIKQIINGPFTFAPDGNPLVGPVQGLTNFWSACAVMAGFSQGGGVGLVLANWITTGDPGFDVWGMDVARYGEWTSLRYTNAKVRENYAHRFSIRFPNEELPAARPQQTTPLYDIMTRDNHAVMGDTWGLEVPLWFAPSVEEAHDKPSFHRSNDFAHVAAEVRAVRERVGISEIANFAKYEVSGSGAEAFLDRLMTNALPRPGRIVLSPMLNEAGKLIGDFTIARIGGGRFMMWGASAAQIYHMRWFERHLPRDGSVRIDRLGQRMVGLTIAGPRARDVLAQVVERDVSNAAFRFMDVAEMDVAGCPATVNRLSYTGDLGYEIWLEPAYERSAYLALKDAGAAHGLRDFGMRALLSMRLEKNFPTWGHELRPIYGPYEGGMERFVNLSKGDFIGRGAALQEARQGPALRRVSFIVQADTADAMADEPIWARVPPRELPHISKPHASGILRHGPDGSAVPAPDMQADGDWRVVGWVTSGGYAYGVGASMAQGYLPADLAGREEEGLFQIEILGQRRAARIVVIPPFDPGGARMRG